MIKSILDFLISCHAPRHREWERFQQSDYDDIILILQESSSASSVPRSRRELYYYLCHNPLLLGEGSLSLTLDEESGRKCYMIGGRGFKIEWQEVPENWSWPSLTNSRFSTVAQLLDVHWFDIKGNIETGILYPEITYGVYLVFKFTQFREGFDGRIVKSVIYLEGTPQNTEITSREVNIPRQSRIREGEWMEIELGQFLNQQQNKGTLVCHLFDHNTQVKKSGIIIEGIEFRPRI